MEHNFYNDDLERLLKEKSDEFRMYPSKRVWHSIYNNMHPGRKWPSIAVSLILISGLFFVGYWNNSSKQEVNIAQLKVEDNAIFSGSTTSKNSNAPALPLKNTSLIKYEFTPLSEVDESTSLVKQFDNGNVTLDKTSSPASLISISGISGNRINSKSKKNTAASSRVNTVEFAMSDVNREVKISKEIPAIANDKTAEDISFAKSNELTELAPDKNNTVSATTSEEEADTEPLTASTENNLSFSLNKNDNESDSKKITEAANTTTKTIAPLTITDKSWIDDYAFYNRPIRKKWKSRIASEIYVTPSAGYRSFTSNTKYDLMANVAAISPLANNTNNNATTLKHKPGFSFEIGAGLIISASKNIRIKAGVQANFTNYLIEVAPVNHPISTTIMLNDINSGFPYLQARTASVANSSSMPGFRTTQIHNQTQQLSIPIGLAVKLAGINNLEWYAGATIQPTYIMGGKANLISSDHKNYINDASMLRNWNANTGLETYFHYKTNNGYTLQFGPQFRYQLASTYSRQYTYTEKLYNLGMKIGLVKNF